MVNFAIRNDKKARLRFAPLQSAAGEALKKRYSVSPDADTVVFIDKGKAYTYARAAIRVCRHLDWPVRILYAFIIIPGFISQPFYKWFARHRYSWFGKKDTCMIPTADVRSRFLD
jgi:predicted DCC family thiol-disulfide oxidoreductase YuxK